MNDVEKFYSREHGLEVAALGVNDATSIPEPWVRVLAGGTAAERSNEPGWEFETCPESPRGLSVLLEKLDDPLDAVNNHGDLLGVVCQEIGEVAERAEEASWACHDPYMRGIAKAPATCPVDPSKTLAYAARLK